MRDNPLELIVYLVTCILALLLGMAVLLKNRQNRINLYFGFYIFNFIFWIVANYLSDTVIDYEAALFWARMSLLGPLIVVPTFLRISQIFPRGESDLKTVLITWLFPFILMLFLPTSYNVKAIIPHDWGVEFIPGPLYIFSTILFVSYVGLAIRNLFKKKVGSSISEKNQITLIMFGAFTTVFISLLVSAILPLLDYSRLAFLAPASTLFLYGSLGYAIIKHRFLDINYFIARAISFTLLTIFLVVIYGLALFRIPSFLPSSFQASAYISISIILAYTFGPIRRYAEHLTDGIFHREPYSSEEFLASLGDVLRSTINLEKLTKLVQKELVETLKVQYAAFVLVDETGEPTTYVSGETPKITITANTVHNFITASDYKPILFDELAESPVKDLLRSMSIGAVLPLTVKSTHYGLVLLGQKKSGDTFTGQDVDVFNILLPQLAIAVQNAKSFDEISKFNIKLKEEVERQTKDLKKANEHLKKLDQLKDEFVFIATHELKNPVTAMRGYLSMLNEGSYGELPQPIRDPIQQLTISNQQLVELVNDLLHIARSEAKTIKLAVEPVDLKQVVTSITEGMKPLFEEKHLTLIHEAPLPVIVQADTQKVKEVIQNLVSNAIKYSTQGTITIKHDIKEEEIITHVIDQGRGIGPDDLKKLFNRFFRSDEVVMEGIPGTGLGLFIVKQLVEKMRGNIWVTSEVNVGTTFSFSLPRIS